MRYLNLIVFISVISFVSCKKDVSEEAILPDNQFGFSVPDEAPDYSVYIPAHVQEDPIFSLFSDNETSENPTTNEGAQLGRILFHDKRLSIDNTISCSSCHAQEKAFSDFEMFSEGINAIETPRNSMAIFNMRYNRNFFWDIRENNLEEQVIQPILHPEEMAGDFSNIIAKLRVDVKLKEQFLNVFGDEEVTQERVSFALSQFLRSLVSFNSKYDQGIELEYANFSQLELDGLELFFNGEVKCNNCHNGQLFHSREAMSNGLDSLPSDLGVGELSGEQAEMGIFKVVSLRNIEFTSPYMHDGRFQTLEEVIEFYDHGVLQHENLNHRFTQDLQDGGPPISLNLTDYEKESLVAFLKTLSDYDFISDEKFSDPFE